jgi:hypothetical protein
LLNAIETMKEVATYINEYKRRKDMGELKYTLYASMYGVHKLTYLT